MRALPVLLTVACLHDGKSDDDTGGSAWDTGQETRGSVDLLLLVDNSASTAQEVEALGWAFESLVDALYYSRLDATVSFTSVSAEVEDGDTEGEDPGEAGSLYAPPIAIDGPEAAAALREVLFCSATAWNEVDVEPDATFVCDEAGLAAATAVSTDYLDCLCGSGAWEHEPGSGSEEPLESAFLATCRAVSSPGADCFDEVSPIDASAAGSNAGMLREGAVLHLLHVGDEGDDSRRIAQGDSDPTPYADAFDATGLSWSWSTFGPDYNPKSGVACAQVSVPGWSVERLQALALASGGVYLPLTEGEGDDCGLADLGGMLGEWVTGFAVGADSEKSPAPGA